MLGTFRPHSTVDPLKALRLSNYAYPKKKKVFGLSKEVKANIKRNAKKLEPLERKVLFGFLRLRPDLADLKIIRSRTFPTAYDPETRKIHINRNTHSRNIDKVINDIPGSINKIIDSGFSQSSLETLSDLLILRRSITHTRANVPWNKALENAFTLGHELGHAMQFSADKALMNMQLQQYANKGEINESYEAIRLLKVTTEKDLVDTMKGLSLLLFGARPSDLRNAATYAKMEVAPNLSDLEYTKYVTRTSIRYSSLNPAEREADKIGGMFTRYAIGMKRRPKKYKSLGIFLPKNIAKLFISRIDEQARLHLPMLVGENNGNVHLLSKEKAKVMSEYLLKDAGVGEKGVFSNILKEVLGTFRPHSTVDPLKASEYGERITGIGTYTGISPSSNTFNRENAVKFIGLSKEHMLPALPTSEINNTQVLKLRATETAGKLVEHSGVGEHGATSKFLSKLLGTFHLKSTVSPILASMLAESTLAFMRKTKSAICETTESLMKKVFSKYSISKSELENWIRNGRLSQSLQRRGANLKEVKLELSSVDQRVARFSVDQKAFLSPSEKKAIIYNDIRQSTSLLSGKEYSSKLAYDNMGVKLPDVYGRQTAPHPTEVRISPQDLHTEPIMDSSIVRQTLHPADISGVKSYVHVIVQDGGVNLKKLDTILSKSL
jgi:predicted metal-dependent enzyme (double-stranded beta helix superfamily)